MSDTNTSQSSGILQKLLPGDIVLADRGFDIEESIGIHQAKLQYLPLPKEKLSRSKRNCKYLNTC